MFQVHSYKGDPREYDPRDPRIQEYHRAVEESMKRGMLQPPPAHSHHYGPHGASSSSHRSESDTRSGPDLHHSRDKSPASTASYHGDRPQHTPPALRPTSAQYGVSVAGMPERLGQSPHQQGQRISQIPARNTIGNDAIH